MGMPQQIMVVVVCSLSICLTSPYCLGEQDGARAATTKDMVAARERPAAPITAVAWHPAGQVAAVGVHDRLLLFDAAGNRLEPGVSLQGRITVIRFDAAGRWLAVAHGEAGRQGVISLFVCSAEGKLLHPRPIYVLAGSTDALYALAFQPQGRLLAAAGYDRAVRLWQLPAAADVEPIKAPQVIQPQHVLKDHSDAVYAITFHPQGYLLASGGADRSVKVWRVADGQRLYTLSEMTDWVYTVAWHPDGKRLVAGGADRTLRLWLADEKEGKLITTVFAHERPVWRVLFSSDGNTLYSLGEEGVIKNWEVPRLTERRVLPAQPETVLDLALHPQQTRLLLGRFDGRALIVDDAGRPVTQLLPLRPQPLQIEAITPEAVQRGQTIRLTVHGRHLEHLRQVTVSQPSVKVQWELPRGPDNPLHLDLTVPADTPLGALQLQFHGLVGSPVTRSVFVDRFPLVVERGTGDAARVGEAIRLPVTISGVLDRPGDEDYYRFTAKGGDAVGVQVMVEEIGSKLAPVLTLIDNDGKVLAEGERFLGCTLPRDGVYALAIRDQQFRGSKDFTYRLHIGPIPVITGVFPLAVPRGKTTAVQLRGVHLGATSGLTVPVTVPAEAAPGSKWAVPLPPMMERPLGAAQVVVDTLDGRLVDPQQETHLHLGEHGYAADGILTHPGTSHTFRFTAREGDTWVVEVLARRAGSPLDPVVEILDSTGQPVPRAVLRPLSVFYVTFRDHEATSPGIRLESWHDLAIDDYLYAHGELMRVLALPRNPDDDCQFYQFEGRRLAFLGTTPAVHHQGTPLYKVEIHPPGRTFPPNGLPLFTLYYRNDDGGPEYGKDAYLIFTAPATGTYQVRLRDARAAGGPDYAYRLRVRRPLPDFSVQLRPARPVLWQGGAAALNVQVSRRDGFDGPVSIQLVDLPKGFTSAPSFIEAGQFTTTIALAAEPQAQLPPQYRLKLIARAQINGREVIREAFSELLPADALRPPSDLVCRPRVQALTIRPGEETRFVVDIERLGGFQGRVPLDVRGLPHGVRVLNVGLNGILITERETSREIVLYAEPWVRPMEHPIVVLARHEAKGTEHAAPAILLKVEK